MKPFTPEQHRNALIRRRIKFVVEKGAMARLFKSGTNSELQEELFRNLKLEEWKRGQIFILDLPSPEGGALLYGVISAIFPESLGGHL